MKFREVLFRYIDTNAGLSYDFRYGYATKIALLRDAGCQ
jgi:hypothetical protein